MNENNTKTSILHQANANENENVNVNDNRQSYQANTLFRLFLGESLGCISFIKNTSLCIFSTDNKLCIFDKFHSRILKRIIPKKLTMFPDNPYPKYKLLNNGTIIIANDLQSLKIFSLYSGKIEKTIILPGEYMYQAGFLDRVWSYELKEIMIELITPTVIGFTIEYKGLLTLRGLNDSSNDRNMISLDETIRCSKLVLLSENHFAILADQKIIICDSKTCTIFKSHSIKEVNLIGVVSCIDSNGRPKLFLASKNEVKSWNYVDEDSLQSVRTSKNIILKMIGDDKKLILLESNGNGKERSIRILDSKTLEEKHKFEISSEVKGLDMYSDCDIIYIANSSSLYAYSEAY